MHTRRFTSPTPRVAALVILVSLAAVATLTATPDRAPIALELVPPRPDMKRGDVADTVIAFRALADLQRLEVSVYVAHGVEILSAPTGAVFSDVKTGDAPQLNVRVRLTAEEFGSLAVSYRTQTARETAVRVKTIIYGDSRH